MIFLQAHIYSVVWGIKQFEANILCFPSGNNLNPIQFANELLWNKNPHKTPI